MFENVKTVLFDMDGTLIDSVGVWNAVDVELISELGGNAKGREVQLQRDAVLRENRDAGNPYLEYCRFLGAKYRSEANAAAIMKRRYEISEEYLAQRVKYKEKADEFVRLLRMNGISTAIVSSTRRDNMEIYRKQNVDIMTRAPLDEWFDGIYTREDAPSGYYKLQFNALYYVGTEAESATLTTYVKVVGAPGSGNVESEGSGSSTPRVIVTGFTTDPAEVNAGDTFTLTLHLKNTSKRTAVSNMLVNFTAPSEGSDTENTYAAFLPTSGSNTAYISSIGKNATTDLSIEMTAKSDLSQKPYQLDVTMDYEDDAYTAYTSTADVSIPIHQAAKFELSTPEILPATISVGNEADIMFSIYNTGKTTLYNVQVKFEGDSITGGESFIGKIEAGGTGTVDALVTGQAATKDDGTIKAVITYEDESGNESSYEQEMTLMVTEDMGVSDYNDWDMEEVEYDDSTGSSKKAVIITLIGVVLLTIAVVIEILLKKR